jgi:hypothetical protein
MSTITAFDRAVAYWSFGSLASDMLPPVAIQALQDGIESPSLLELAAANSGANADLHRLFRKALAELGRRELSKAEAGRIIARDYAYHICAGKIAPIEGARSIWQVSLESEALTRELAIFGGRASEYDDLPALRERISHQIVSEAQALIGNCPGTRDLGDIPD